VTIPLTFDEIDKAEAAAAVSAEKQKVMDAKRLVQYPIRVRKVKRLRRQISGLMRCIRDYEDYSNCLFDEMMALKKVANIKINTLAFTGIICFVLGWLVG
jgi:hypothetical protein